MKTKTKTPKIVIKRIKQKVKNLGRHVVHDPRSRDFVAKMAKTIRSVQHAATGLPLDQGQLGSCTGNAAAGAMNSDPYFTKGGGVVRDEAFAVELYHLETSEHPKYGVYPPADPGGCGLWVAKILQEKGLIKSYAHAFGVDAALRAIVLRPCIVGVNWYQSMFDCDPQTGLVEIKGSTIAGGHEIVADGIDAPNKLVWFWNSWGAWGYQNSGRFCMTFDTFDRLLQEQGDCTQFHVVT